MPWKTPELENTTKDPLRDLDRTDPIDPPAVKMDDEQTFHARPDRPVKVGTPIRIIPFPGGTLDVSQAVDGRGSYLHRYVVLDEEDAECWISMMKNRVIRRFYGHELFDTVKIAKGAELGPRINFFADVVGVTAAVRGSQQSYIKTDVRTNNVMPNQLPRGYVLLVERIEFQVRGGDREFVDALMHSTLISMRVGCRMFESLTADRCPYRLEVGRLIDEMRGFYPFADIRGPAHAQEDLEIRLTLAGILGTSYM